MNVAAWIVGVVLMGVFTFAGATKVLDLDRAREHFGYTAAQFRLIGLAELAAVVGIVVGLIRRSIEYVGHAAGIGICSLMIGALLAHARVEDDAKATIPAGVMFVLSVLYMVFLALR